MSRIPKVVLLIESSRSSGRALLGGVADFAHDHGPWSFYWEPGGLESAWHALKKSDADGIILRDVDKLEEVLALGIPAVVIGHRRKEIPGLVNVTTDSRTVGQLAAEHLLQCGFKHFAFVGWNASQHEAATWSQLRQRAFGYRLAKDGFECQTFAVVGNPVVDWAAERAELVAWLRALPKPIGLMTCNDDCGVQVMEACKVAGISVPDQIGVIGADNDEIVCGLSNPAMSSVAINFERAGFEAAEALARLMRGQAVANSKITVCATHVVARRSTDIVAISDEPLSRALRFIRAQSKRAISVGEVATAAGLSRRALERRFRSEVGCSVLEQIRRVRTDQISRLLVETTLPVGEIAESLGFEDSQHFARYFRSAKEMSPLAYRKSFGKPGRRRAQNGVSLPQTGVERTRNEKLESPHA